MLLTLNRCSAYGSSLNVVNWITGPGSNAEFPQFYSIYVGLALILARNPEWYVIAAFSSFRKGFYPLSDDDVTSYVFHKDAWEGFRETVMRCYNQVITELWNGVTFDLISGFFVDSRNCDSLDHHRQHNVMHTVCKQAKRCHVVASYMWLLLSQQRFQCHEM